jgi:cytochrome c peroxidase
VPALFTDHTYDNVGVPRNWAIGFNNDNTTLPDYITANGTNLGAPNHRYYDVGLCGPTRSDLAVDPTQCGRFKVPTLRNIALKQHYFHNGMFDNLDDVVNWYVTRDLNPTHWYTTADGQTPDKQYNDLPKQYDGNVNREEVPYNVEGGQHMNTAEMKDLIVFLCTLTDGYDAKNPSAYPYPDQCKAAQR